MEGKSFEIGVKIYKRPISWGRRKGLIYLRMRNSEFEIDRISLPSLGEVGGGKPSAAGLSLRNTRRAGPDMSSLKMLKKRGL